jgi:hypothetical protein
MDLDRLAAVSVASFTAVRSGTYQPDTLYVLAPNLVDTARRSLKGSDAIVSVDDLFVVAPRWFDCQPCRSIPVRIVAGGQSP